MREPALLTRPGLIARYDLMEMLVAFSQASGAAGGPPSIWLLIPQAEQGPPQIDGAVLPVISGGELDQADRTLARQRASGRRPQRRLAGAGLPDVL